MTTNWLVCRLRCFDDRVQDRFGHVVIDLPYGICTLTNQKFYGAFCFRRRVDDEADRRPPRWTSIQHIAAIKQTRSQLFARLTLFARGASLRNLFDPIFFNRDCAFRGFPPATDVQKRGAFDNEWGSLRPSHVNG